MTVGLHPLTVMLRAALFAAAMVEACVAFAPGLPRNRPRAAPAHCGREAGGAPAHPKRATAHQRRRAGARVGCTPAPVLAYGVVTAVRGCSAVSLTVLMRSPRAPYPSGPPLQAPSSRGRCSSSGPTRCALVRGPAQAWRRRVVPLPCPPSQLVRRCKCRYAALPASADDDGVRHRAAEGGDDR